MGEHQKTTEQANEPVCTLPEEQKRAFSRGVSARLAAENKVADLGYEVNRRVTKERYLYDITDPNTGAVAASVLGNLRNEKCPSYRTEYEIANRFEELSKTLPKVKK
jgi:hypothetical protein